uniref:Immunoglobulin domain-containing protein n=1 Tax=Haplochromis burtoni TaxID=8153 RepID=A0A3Q2X4G7_HAPBU
MLSPMQIKLTPVATQQTNKIVAFYSPKLKHRLPEQLCSNTKNTVKTSVLVYEGYSGDIICSYEPRYQNYFKYICRGKRSSTCLQQALITSDNKQNGRIKFNDDKRSGKFTMTITSLAQSDSGTYLCGVQKNSVLDVFSAVELNVKGERS